RRHLRYVLAHRGQYRPRLERLGNVVIRASQPPADLVEESILAGEHDHRDVLVAGVALDDLAELVAVHVGEDDVEKDKDGIVLGYRRQASHPARGAYHA